MNRGTRMSSALAMVSPRPAGGSITAAEIECLTAPRRAGVAAEQGQPTLAVVAQVPDVAAADVTAADVAAAPHDPTKEAASPDGWRPWNPAWKLPRPKFRLAYLKVAAVLMRFDLAACWAWVLSLPPIVKLGTVMASLVMSLWMFAGGGSDAPVETTSPSAWRHDVEAGKQDTATSGAGGSVTERSSTSVGTSAAGRADDVAAVSPIQVARINNDQHGHSGHRDGYGDAPSIREIQEAARGRAPTREEDRWPDELAADAAAASSAGGRIAHATVRPIPPHRTPHARDGLPLDATPRDSAGGDWGGVDSGASRFNEGPQPPNMAPTWAGRPQPTHTSAYPPVQTNPHYADTAVARAPTHYINERTSDAGYLDRRTNGGRHDDDRAHRDTADQWHADRRYDDGRSPAYDIGRERIEAERRTYSDTYRR